MADKADTTGSKTTITLFFAAAGFIVLLGAFMPRDSEPELAVTATRVRRATVVERVMATGEIRSTEEVTISPQVAGEIVQLPVSEGQLVTKGQLLVVIRPDSYIAARNLAKAAFDAASITEQINRVVLNRAEKEFVRNQELHRSTLISDSTFLESQSAYDQAKLQLDAAVAQVAEAKYNLDKAEDDLSMTKIESPMDGTVISLKSHLGERVLGTSFNTGTEIMTIANLESMEAQLRVSEADLKLIKPKQEAELELDAFGKRRFSGVVTAIGEVALGLTGKEIASSQDQNAITFQVRVRVDKDHEQLLPGMSVIARIITQVHTNVLTVPLQSLAARVPPTPRSRRTLAGRNSDAPPSLEDSNDKAGLRSARKPIEVVFVVSGNMARQVHVEHGINDGDYVEVNKGLQPGQWVISGGYKAISTELADRKRIRVTRWGDEP